MSIALLDKTKEKLGSDSKIAAELGKTRAYISQIRHGVLPMPDWMAVKLASIVGDNPVAALLENKLATAKDDEERAVWFQYANGFERTTGTVLEISGPKAAEHRLAAQNEKPAIKPARRNVGRRDWTRTNDPYHVKVVL